MTLPNFVVIGAQKSGTGSIWRYLRQHPAIFMASVKETNFFVARGNWRRGVGWYESLFATGAGDGVTAVGEASPNYTMFPHIAGVPKRMAELIPSARLIYLLRDPIERMHSSYLHALSMGTETWPMRQALLQRAEYANTSRYAMQLEQYLRHFERSQVLIVLTEDLARRPEETIDRILAFLDLPTGWRPPDLGVRYHTTALKRVPRRWARLLGALGDRGRMPRSRGLARVAASSLATRPLGPAELTPSPELRRQLEDLIRPDVARLAEHLGEGFRGWGLLS